MKNERKNKRNTCLQWIAIIMYIGQTKAAKIFCLSSTNSVETASKVSTL